MPQPEDSRAGHVQTQVRVFQYLASGFRQGPGVSWDKAFRILQDALLHEFPLLFHREDRDPEPRTKLVGCPPQADTQVGCPGYRRKAPS